MCKLNEGVKKDQTDRLIKNFVILVKQIRCFLLQ